MSFFLFWMGRERKGNKEGFFFTSFFFALVFFFFFFFLGLWTIVVQ